MSGPSTPPPPDHTLHYPPPRPARDNPFAGFTLLLVLAGLVPPLRTVAWGMALVSGTLAIVASRRGGGRKQLTGAAAVAVLELAAPHLRQPARSAPEPVATAPRPAEPAPAVVKERPAVIPPKPAPKPKPKPKPRPKRPPPPRPRPESKRPPRAAPEAAPRAEPRPAPRRTTTTRTTTTRTPPKPAPRPTPPPPRVAERPRTSEITTLRGSLAVAESQMNQGAYNEAAATIRSVQRQAADFPEIQQYARVLAIENRQACRAEAEALRRRGESVRSCP
ncbi:MAG: hypothetical protein AVDCRST_MAG68-4079 [uncultured Gemmatimonadetes bacterium]|uniref:Uncharacterized protein n=1 Tax=uncultured Gemmatimonadota bacterium TaxID=203437 RepID=A0A6J4MJ38_9BACT|nr:MAG: hypothetical protein AVDCRST_MAG68-4079 [uncultured Gemmatimonadota bacterium]